MSSQKGFSPVITLLAVITIGILMWILIYLLNQPTVKEQPVNIYDSQNIPPHLLSATPNPIVDESIENINFKSLRGQTLVVIGSTLYKLTEKYSGPNEKIKIFTSSKLGNFSRNVDISTSGKYLFGSEKTEYTTIDQPNLGRYGIPSPVSKKYSLVTVEIPSMETKKVCTQEYAQEYYYYGYVTHPQKDQIVYIDVNDKYQVVSCNIENSAREVLISTVKPYNQIYYSSDGKLILLRQKHGGPSTTSDYAVIKSDGTDIKVLPKKYNYYEF